MKETALKRKRKTPNQRFEEQKQALQFFKDTARRQYKQLQRRDKERIEILKLLQNLAENGYLLHISTVDLRHYNSIIKKLQKP